MKIFFLLAILISSPVTFAQNKCIKQDSVAILKKCSAVKILVGVTPGGASDLFARDLQSLLSSAGITGVVENKPGASGHIAANQLLGSTDKNCTFMMGTGASLAINSFNPSLKPPLNPLTTFEPIGLVASNPMLLVVNKEKVRARSVDQFIEAMKSKSLFYATPGVGSTNNFSAVLLDSLVKGALLEHIPTKGASEAQLLLKSGEIDFVLDNPTTVQESDKVLILGNTSAKPVRFKGNIVPPINHGLNTKSFFGVVGAKGVDSKNLAGLENFIKCMTTTDTFKSKYENLGFKVEAGDASALKQMISEELKTWQPVANKVFTSSTKATRPSSPAPGVQ